MSHTDDDLPGMLAVAKGVAEQKFPHTMDAQVWAAEFAKINPVPEEDTMIGWFANAIMAGYDTANARNATSQRDCLDAKRRLATAAARIAIRKYNRHSDTFSEDAIIADAVDAALDEAMRAAGQQNPAEKV